MNLWYDFYANSLAIIKSLLSVCHLQFFIHNFYTIMLRIYVTIISKINFIYYTGNYQEEEVMTGSTSFSAAGVPPVFSTGAPPIQPPTVHPYAGNFSANMYSPGSFPSLSRNQDKPREVFNAPNLLPYKADILDSITSVYSGSAPNLENNSSSLQTRKESGFES